MAKKLVELDQQHYYQLLDLIEEKDEDALDNELDKHDDLQNDLSIYQTSDKASRGISLASSEKVQVPGVPFQSPTKLRFAFVDFDFTFLFVHTMLTAMQNLDRISTKFYLSYFILVACNIWAQSHT